MANKEKFETEEVQSFFSADVVVNETAGNYEEEIDEDDEINNTYFWISLTVFLTWILSFLIL